MSQLRVLHVVPTTEGGAYRSALELMVELEKEHLMSTQLCVLGKQIRHSEILNSSSKPIYLGAANAGAASSISSSVWKLRNIVRAGRYDIVHSHLYPADLVAAFASAAVGRIPHLAHLRDTPPGLSAGGVKRRTKKALLRVAYSAGGTRFVAVSQAAADYALHHLSLDRRRLAVVMNGIDPHRIAVKHAHAEGSVGREGITIAAAGRLVPEKGLDVLIKATASLVKAKPQLILRIAGSGSQRRHLAELANSLGIAGNVQFVDEIRDMANFYAGVDIFVLSSLSSEGLPRVILEAMFAGVPIVATDTAGTCEAISDGVTGVVVRAGDAKELASAIATLLANSAKRATLAEAARQLAWRKFTVRRVANEIADQYRCLLSE